MNVVNQLFKTHFMVIHIFFLFFHNNFSNFASEGFHQINRYKFKVSVLSVCETEKKIEVYKKHKIIFPKVCLCFDVPCLPSSCFFLNLFNEGGNRLWYIAIFVLIILSTVTEYLHQNLQLHKTVTKNRIYHLDYRTPKKGFFKN